MKTARALIVAALLLTSISIYVHAEDQPILTATIPFGFKVENTNLPAGTYDLSVLLPYNMVKMQSTDGKNTVFVYSIPFSMGEGSKDTRLVFHHVGAEYFLSQIWEQGNHVRRELRKGSLARELARVGERMQSTTVFASSESR